MPLILCAPGGMPSQRCDSIVEAVDIVPTLLDLAAIQRPPFLQGDSLAGIVEGGAAPSRQMALTEGAGWKTLRTQESRYLVQADGIEQLWDLSEDPDGYFDVADQADYAETLSECRRLLLARLLEIERPLPRTWTY